MAAAAKHADVKAMAAGDEASQLKGRQMIMETATKWRSQNSYAMRQESDDQFREAPDFAVHRLAISATAIAADLI